MKIYRHFYDNNKDVNGDKPNEYLGEFEIREGDVSGYEFTAIGIRKEDGKKYKIFGQEVSALVNRYNAGTKCFIEQLKDLK